MNRLLSRTIRLSSVLSVCMLLTIGCWSRIEINDRAFVTSMYVDDAGNGQVRVSLGFPLPNRLVQGQSGGVSNDGNPYTHVTKEGKTIAEAIRKIQNDLSREINWGSNRIIVVSSQYAKQGMQPLMEYLGRLPHIQLKTYLFVAKEEAEKIPRMSAVFERFPSEVLREFARRRMTLNATLRDLMGVQPYGGSLTMGLLLSRKENLASEKNKMGEWVGTEGAALIKNYKWVGQMGAEQTEGALWIMNRMKSTIVKASSPSDERPVTFDIIKSRSRIRPVWDKDDLVFKMKITLQAQVLASDSNLRITDPANIAKLRTALKEEVERIIRKAFDESLRHKADFYKLGERVELRYPKRFASIKERWQHYYAEHARLELEIDPYIKRAGGEQDPLRAEYGEQEGGGS